jgi:NAD+ synthetase
VTLGGVRCGINICADIWEPGAAELAHAAGAELLLVLNASPCHLEKHHQRVRYWAIGSPRPAFRPFTAIWSAARTNWSSTVLRSPSTHRRRLPDATAAVRGSAGYRRFRRRSLRSDDMVDDCRSKPRLTAHWCWAFATTSAKAGFKGAIIGLSGGIDSALTLCVAVDALGADRVRAVMMPSPYTAQMSLDDSRAMIAALGVRYDEIPIAPAMQTYQAMLDPLFAGLPADTTEENIQARIRGNLLMALSNKTGALVLTTGNKSEMAVGYCTLYGDMAGGFAVIKDVYKTLVYRLSRYRKRCVRIGAGHSGKHHRPAAVGRVEAGPDRSGLPAALRGARCHRSCLHGRGPQPA